jgi:hypothetical protein
MCWSDCRAGTVIKVTPTRVVWQRDKVTLINRDELTVKAGGFAAHWSGEQKYTYELDETAATTTFTLRKDGRWICTGGSMSTGRALVPGRLEYYDYNF